MSLRHTPLPVYHDAQVHQPPKMQPLHVYYDALVEQPALEVQSIHLDYVVQVNQDVPEVKLQPLHLECVNNFQPI